MNPALATIPIIARVRNNFFIRIIFLFTFKVCLRPNKSSLTGEIKKASRSIGSYAKPFFILHQQLAINRYLIIDRMAIGACGIGPAVDPKHRQPGRRGDRRW
jgi:hypothetical protein